jgi:hypothetical protein
MWYAEHFATRYDAVDRTFCDAIKFGEKNSPGRRNCANLNCICFQFKGCPEVLQCSKTSALERQDKDMAISTLPCRVGFGHPAG